ncbi:unnamed protein product [Closterium sp. Yama58-4]|nr:unnamed protein product [Closterium sp. Yama58-4]
MHRRLLVSGLPRSLPPLPASPAPPCLPCVEGRQHAAPHSSSFPPTEAPLQTLHLDVWGPARVRGQGGERYFLLVVDDYSRYTTVFPLRTKGEKWRVHLRPLAGLLSKGGHRVVVTLPSSPQQNGVAERRIGLVMEIARTSLIHAAAPHFLWPFAVRYATHQLNLWLRVSLPDTSPTLRWTGEVGDASQFRVWAARTLVRDTSADKLSSCTIPCVFLGFVPDAPGWQFYHPTSRRVFPSQDVTFDESVPFYRLFPYRTAPLPPPPLFLTLAEGGDVAADDAAALRHTPRLETPPGFPPRPSSPPLQPVAVDSGAAGGGAARGAASGGAEPVREVLGGAEPRGAEPTSAEPGGADPEGAKSGGAESAGIPSGLFLRRGPLSPHQLREWLALRSRLRSWRGSEFVGAEPSGAESAGGSPCAASQRSPLSPQQLREWLASRTRLRSRAAGAGGAGSGGAAAGGTGAGDPGAGDPGAGGAGSGGAAAGGTGAGDPGAGGAGSGGAAAGGTGAGGPGAGAVDPGVGDPGAGGVGFGSAAAGGTRVGGPGAGAVDPGVGNPWAGGAGSGGAAAGGAGAGGAGAGGAGAGGFGAAGGAGAGGSGAAGGAGATGAGGTAQPQLFFAPPSPSSLPPPDSVLRQVLSLPSSTGLPLQPGSPLPAPSPYTEQTDSLTERREPASRPASPRVPLPSPPASSLPDVPDPESDLFRAAHPSFTRLLATFVTDPSFESVAASALVAELVDFATARRLNYAASLVAESESVCPPSVGGECAFGTDVLEDRQEDFECLAAAVPHLVAMLLAPEGDPDAPDIPTPRSYAEAITGPYSS